MYKKANIFEIHLNPAMLVLIGKLSLSTLRWVPICQGVGDFSGLMHYFVFAKLATSNIRVSRALATDTTMLGRVASQKADSWSPGVTWRYMIYANMMSGIYICYIWDILINYLSYILLCSVWISVILFGYVVIFFLLACLLSFLL